MEGVVWASVGGVAFGLFQATNRRGNRDVDPYLATFTVILVSLIALAVMATVIEDPSRLLSANPLVVATFAVAGLLHFFIGWTLLALAQQRVGAARTGVLTGAAPVFGTAIAFLFIGESVRPTALVGVLLVVAGVGLLAGNRGTPPVGTARPVTTGWVFAALTALAWGTSPVLIRHALSQVPTPLSGVTVGMSAAALAYGIALLIRRTRQGVNPTLPRRSVKILAVAGLLVAAGIGTQ